MRLPLLQPLTNRLPAALVSLPGAEQGINPNQLAGALTLLLPLLSASFLGFALGNKRGLAVILALFALPALASLILTRSRAGWIGFAAAVVALALGALWLRGGARVRKTLAVAVPLAVALLLVGGAIALPRLLASGDGAGAAIASGDAVLQQLSLDARIEIWSRAVYALQDFPFTGVGLGAFRRVVNVLYPLFLVPPDADIAHSHNMFLQVGVDLGLIGLVGYVALLLVAGVAAWHTAATGRGLESWVALGALAALVGFHIYGLADALAPGSKPSVVFWVVLGLVAALRKRVAASRAGAEIWSSTAEPAAAAAPPATPASPQPG
jgi:putative inorganic carbon (HCO3(-)) transporter